MWNPYSTPIEPPREPSAVMTTTPTTTVAPRTTGAGSAPLGLSGVLPSVAVRADAVPARSEIGTGGMMSWAGRLWVITYLSHTRTTGSGAGLYEVDADLRLTKNTASVDGTYANRLLHSQSSQAILGPHLIDVDATVRTIPDLVDHRIAATMEHLHDPARKVYFLTMEGLLFDVDVYDLGVRQVADLRCELDVPATAQPHFKSGHTMDGHVYVTNNTYDERDHLGTQAAGRLAEWDGSTWKIIERTGFNEVTGRRNFGGAVFATGWDRASAILQVRTASGWSRYRLPKASRTYDHFWQTEWPRIREVEHERFLMDCHGLFYELTPTTFQEKVWGLNPICTHLRVIPDFCTFRGLVVWGGNQATPTGDASLLAGEPQSGLLFGKIDDLWSWGKPKGWGGPWLHTPVRPNLVSDPYLMTGFDGKTVHVSNDGDRDCPVTIQVDFVGTGEWHEYETVRVPSGGYVHHEFPHGFSAHWVRFLAHEKCTLTAQLIYT